MATTPHSATGTIPARHAFRTLPQIAGIAFSLCWLVGLSVFSSSTQVSSSGTQILHDYAAHRGAVALQYVLTQGLPAAFLMVVAWSLSRSISPPATTSRRLVLTGGLAAATVSLTQLALGLWLSADLVSGRDAGVVGAVFRSINRLDGVKMLLIAVVALVASRASRRRQVALPNWLALVGAALAGTITLSAIGYLALNDTLAMAAWLSLPCLLIFVTGTGITLSRHTGGLPSARGPGHDDELCHTARHDGSVRP